MSRLVNFSESSLIAMHSLLLMAREPGKQLNTKEIAEKIAASENTVSKVLQRLVKDGLISSNRGPSGGFNLVSAPDNITLLRIFEAIEGRIEDGCCPFRHQECLFKECLFGGLICKIQDELKDYLQGKSLKVLAEG
ncbi:MAG: Rrf2 family transcriptional regulator [Spirochaetales bacterium]|nr:Rrf2 family transcriptional regulator [Spirochaetales bacterium]